MNSLRDYYNHKYTPEEKALMDANTPQKPQFNKRGAAFKKDGSQKKAFTPTNFKNGVYFVYNKETFKIKSVPLANVLDANKAVTDCNRAFGGEHALCCVTVDYVLVRKETIDKTRGIIDEIKEHRITIVTPENCIKANPDIFKLRFFAPKTIEIR